jgi:hypothetical protein
MARGWESKAVADQMDDAFAPTAAPEGSRYDVSPAVRERQTRLRWLRMSHARTCEQLKRATNPTHRQMLERAVAALEREMEDLT